MSPYTMRSNVFSLEKQLPTFCPHGWSHLLTVGLSREGLSAADPLHLRPSDNFSFNLDLAYVSGRFVFPEEYIITRRSIYRARQKMKDGASVATRQFCSLFEVRTLIGFTVN